VAAHHHVLQRGHLGEQPDVLEGARDAGLGHLVHGLGCRPAAEHEAAAVGVYSPVMTLKKVVLPAPLGPIRP
jgi:hypothetical protein